MPGQIAKNKRRVTLVLETELVKRLDGRASEEGRSRTALVADAVEAYLSGAPEKSVAEAKLDAIAAKIDAMDSANRVAVAGLREAIESQPVPPLPASDDWKSKGLLDRIMKR